MFISVKDRLQRDFVSIFTFGGCDEYESFNRPKGHA
jgi:hypothetical protein